jgi:hypothetical protein
MILALLHLCAVVVEAARGHSVDPWPTPNAITKPVQSEQHPGDHDSQSNLLKPIRRRRETPPDYRHKEKRSADTRQDLRTSRRVEFLCSSIHKML